MKSTGALLLWIALCLGMELLAAYFTSLSVKSWYPTLARPAWRPPDWLFGPVWTVLYVSMGLAAWRVWSRHGWKGASGALAVFLIQLVLNGAWSWFFFGLRSPALALVEIVLLWLAVLATLVLFWRADAVAGMLIAPYWLWVNYAFALNWSIWRLNR